MNSENVAPNLSSGQILPAETEFFAAFDQAIGHCRAIRNSTLSRNRRHRLGICAGQVALLLVSIREGKRLNRRNLARFLWFVAGGARMIFREPPPTAANQREKILRLLREATRTGEGIAGDVLRREHCICQAPARVWELKNQYGYQIETRQDRVTRMATYFFRGDPPEGWQPPAKQARLRLLNSEAPKADFGPLFQTVTRG